MQRKPLSKTLIEFRMKLQADEKQMAKQMRVSLATYKSLESGARVLPLKNRNALIKRAEALLRVCGLK